MSLASGRAWGLSLALHLAVAALAVWLPAQAARRLPPPPRVRPVPRELVLLDLLNPAAASPPPGGTLPIAPTPRPSLAPRPTPHPTPRPSPGPTARPTPGPTPTPLPRATIRPTPLPTPRILSTPSARPSLAPSTVPSSPPIPPAVDDHAVFEVLRRDPAFRGMTDEQIRKTPLPPGMTSWREVLKMTGQLDQLDWTGTPPQTGQDAATGSAGFFGWAPTGLGGDAYTMGAARRERVGATWRFAFQYTDVVLVAEWPEGATVARVAHYAFGGRPDPAKVFEVKVRPDDAAMTGDMIAQLTLIRMGMPPVPARDMP